MKGDVALEKNENRKDSLDPKFTGSYVVLNNRGNTCGIFCVVYPNNVIYRLHRELRNTEITTEPISM